MGIGSSIARHGGPAIFTGTSNAPSSSLLPLSSEERVAAVATTPAAAAASPAPPATGYTSNPRQRLKDANAAPTVPWAEATPLPPAAPQPYRRFLPRPGGTPILATPPPTEAGATAPRVELAAASRRVYEESRTAKPQHPAQASHPTRWEDGRHDAAGDAFIGGDHLHRGPPQYASIAAHPNVKGNADVRFAVRAPKEGRQRHTPLRSEGGLYEEEREGQGAASAKSSPSPNAPEAEELAATSCASVEAMALTEAPAAPAAAGPCQLNSTFTAYRPVARSASPGVALGQYDGLPLVSVQQVLESKHKVYRVCLTGGPCAGKSTMLSAIQSKIPQRTGFRVMCVPEAATLLVTGGMQWDNNLTVPQQLGLLRTQLALEDQFYALAVASNVPTIIVSDRGTMDGRAFCTDAQFQEILHALGSTIDALRDRYDAVIHMVTAADGAEGFYNLDNPARYEDLDGARASDLRLREMYVGHPMYRLLDNSTTFDDKIERGLQVICQVVHKAHSAPASPTHYLVRRCPSELPVACATYTTYTTVLSNSKVSDIRLLVRREMADGSTIHFFKSVRESPSSVSAALSSRALPRAISHTGGGASFPSSANARTANTAAPMQERIESAQRISSREFASLCKHRDRTRAEVVVRATHFLFEGANYELTTLVAPSWAAGRQTLTVESGNVSAAQPQQGHRGGPCHAGLPLTALRLPPFLEVDREVPVESLTTAFLISHKETGPLYTSLAFAPVFSRAVVTPLGAHADTENILQSTLSTPRATPGLRAETGALPTFPTAAEAGAEARAPANVSVPGEGGGPEEGAENSAPNAAPLPLPTPVRRGLAPLNANTLLTSVTVRKSAAAKAEGARHLESDPPPDLDESACMDKGHKTASPSRLTLAGVEGEEDVAEPDTAVPAGERLQPESAMMRDPERILPPIRSKKSACVAALGN
ncbi:hypothetical protein LSCM1_03746 [Leishmania martiniquensis]|uniref:NadR/Ttd14 AAA domain-containing protein n=1 Tax=Leishmania martiniquensis TaxID=1580590 RepID=A0A836FZR7_9TRYP|nr:hypothetical protein LSCM1_03746 [Leishmania martiniquensis]